MNVYLEVSHPCADDRLMQARRDLIGLMAEEKQNARELHDLRSEITKYEQYAKEALNLNEESLALEIAEKIASVESRMAYRESINNRFTNEIQVLRDAVHRLERQLRGGPDRLTYLLGVLEAEAELAEGGEWRDLDRKMRQAGIGPEAAARDKILARIRAELGVGE